MRLRQPAFHAVEGDIHFAYGGVAESIVGLGEGGFFHDHVTVAQASAHILTPQLDHDQSRRMRRAFPRMLRGSAAGFPPNRVRWRAPLARRAPGAAPMGDHHHGQRAVREGRQPIPPPRQPLDPARRPRARREVVLDGLRQG